MTDVFCATCGKVGLFKVEKTCRTVQADAQDDWFGPDQRREQTTCEWKVVSRL